MKSAVSDRQQVAFAIAYVQKQVQESNERLNGILQDPSSTSQEIHDAAELHYDRHELLRYFESLSCLTLFELFS